VNDINYFKLALMFCRFFNLDRHSAPEELPMNSDYLRKRLSGFLEK